MAVASAFGSGDVTDPVEIEPPDIAAYRTGNIGIPYALTFDSGRPGPHAAICGLIHGNEICGAVALSHLLERDVLSSRGRLSVIFAKTEAYSTFDPDNPNAARYIDEDMNRLWTPAAVFEHEPTNVERARVHVLRPLIDSVDILLDLHSMQADTTPLYLAGTSAKARRFAHSLGGTATIVCDAGHANGVRMRDYGPFNDDDVDQVSLLAECGQHWRRKTADMATDTAYRFLFRLEMTPRDTAAPYILPATPPDDWIEITHVFVPESDRARFTEPFARMEVIAKPGTVIAHDGHNAITTPYDDWVLIMPARRLVKNQTGARLGRLHPFAGSDDG